MTCRRSVATAIFVTALCVGCQGQRRAPESLARAENIDLGSPANAGAWLFWPTSLRVHPLTRANPTADPPSLDVRVEFLDRDEQSTRAVGTVVIVLTASSAAPHECRFVFPLTDRQENASHYDPVTDTYRFTIVPQWTTVPPRGTAIEIEAMLFGLDGAHPAAAGRVIW